MTEEGRGPLLTKSGLVVVTFNFSTRDDGQVDAWLWPEHPALQEALQDSVSSLPPRGAAGNGPSTYWIDRADQGALGAQKTGDQRPFLWGNSTNLSVQGEMVVGSYDYARQDEPGDAMPFDQFLSLLSEWREKVRESAARAKEPLPEVYRRNPVE